MIYRQLLKSISIILILALLWQQVAWANPGGGSYLRTLALSERRNADHNNTRRDPEGAPGRFLGVFILVAAIFVTAILSGAGFAVAFGLVEIPLRIFFVGISIPGNIIASYLDKDRHWSRYAVGVLMSTIFAVAIPIYVGALKATIPDFGIWWRSLRPLVDLYIMALPLHLLGFAVNGMRERMLKAYEQIPKDTGNRIQRLKLFADKVFTKDWFGKTGAYIMGEKIPLFYSPKGIFKVVVLFWMPIIHFSYYMLSGVGPIFAIAGSIAPWFVVVGAVFSVQRPGKELTDSPRANWILRRVYLVPLVAVPILAVTAFIMGNPAFGWNAVSALVTTAAGFAAYLLYYCIFRLTTYLYYRIPRDLARAQRMTMRLTVFFGVAALPFFLRAIFGDICFAMPGISGGVKAFVNSYIGEILTILAFISYFRHRRLNRIAEVHDARAPEQAVALHVIPVGGTKKKITPERIPAHRPLTGAGLKEAALLSAPAI